MRRLSEDERELVEELKTDKVLLPVNGDLLIGGNTVLVAVFCGDADHAYDKFRHLKNESAGNVHLLTDNGGSIWLDPEFVAPGYTSEMWCGLQKRWTDRVTKSVAIKATNRVALMVHYPCVEATDAFGMGINDLLFSVVRAYWRVKRETDEFLASKGECLAALTRVHVSTLFHHPHHKEERGQTWWVNPLHDRFWQLRPEN